MIHWSRFINTLIFVVLLITNWQLGMVYFFGQVMYVVTQEFGNVR